MAYSIGRCRGPTSSSPTMPVLSAAVALPELAASLGFGPAWVGSSRSSLQLQKVPVLMYVSADLPAITPIAPGSPVVHRGMHTTGQMVNPST